MRKPLVIILIAVFSLSLLVVGLWWAWRQPEFNVQHVVLISIDTCRADHLSCYGNCRITTPHIDQLAGEGILFENVISPAPMTLPSHSSLLSGTNPPYHGIHTNYDHRLGPSNVMLAELLRERGFLTCGIVSAYVLDARFGMDQGFDNYDDQIEQDRATGYINERSGDASARIAVDWLDEHQVERFFLFLHLFDPHAPYAPPEPFASRFAEHPYDGEIAFVDQCIGQVVEKLKTLGLYDSTLIIITSDHGESLGEHGERTHSYFIYDSTIRVPLICKLPGQQRPKRIEEVVGLIDIFPTICSLLNIEPPPQVVGEDLSVCFGRRGLPRRERYQYCESFTPRNYGANVLLGLTDARWKFIQTTRPELYNLAEDPKESRNLLDSMGEQTMRMDRRLQEMLQQQIREDSKSAVKLDDEAIRRLESIGYVGGDAGLSDETDYDDHPDRDDPKDLLDFFNDHSEASAAIAEKDYERARQLYLELVQRRPQFLSGHLSLDRIAREQGDLEAGIPHLIRALQLDPTHSGSHNNLAMAYKTQGEFEKAIAHLHLALVDNPFDEERAKVHANLGDILASLNKNDEAVDHYQRALVIMPDYARSHFRLAQLLHSQGRAEEAIGHFRETIRWNPQHVKARIELGVALQSQSDLDQAVEQFRAVLDVQPNHIVALNRLGDILDVQTKYAEAVTHYRRALEVDENNIEALNNLAWLLATCPEETILQPSEAVRLAQRATETVNEPHPSLFDTLAATYAANGQYELAVKTAEQALQMATELEAQAFVDEIRRHLRFYREGKSYRQPVLHPER